MTRPPWTMEDLLSRARLHPYLAACSGNPAKALRLYGWNSEVSGAFFESLHYLEVGLRNAIDRRLSQWATELGARQSWYADPAVPLTLPSRRKIASARINASRDGRVEVHGKVVAELSFGVLVVVAGP